MGARHERARHESPTRVVCRSHHRHNGHARLARIETIPNRPRAPAALRAAGHASHDPPPGADFGAASPPDGRKEEDGMKSLLATIIGLAMAGFAGPWAGGVAAVTTSIPVGSLGAWLGLSVEC